MICCRSSSHTFSSIPITPTSPAQPAASSLSMRSSQDRLRAGRGLRYQEGGADILPHELELLCFLMLMYGLVLCSSGCPCSDSYAGHYIPAFGYKIHMENKAGSKPMPLTGLAIGDGWVDPIHMIPAYPQLMHVISATDLQQTAVVQSYCDNITALIEAEQYTAAFDIWDQMLNGDVWPYGNYFHNITGLNDYDNYMRTNAPVSFGYFSRFVTRSDIRAKIHVGDLPFNSGHECEMHLLGDFMKTLRPEIGVLMDNYKVLVYSGQLDVIIAPVLTDRFLPYVNWTGQAQLDQAPRYIWKVSPSDTEIAGYARVVNVGGNFTRVVLRGAGHIVPHDQPARAYDMMDRFIHNLPYSPKQEQ